MWRSKPVFERIVRAYFRSKRVVILSYEEITDEVIHAVVRYKNKNHGVVYTGSDERPAVFMESMIFIIPVQNGKWYKREMRGFPIVVLRFLRQETIQKDPSYEKYEFVQSDTSFNSQKFIQEARQKAQS